jgi:hypothetical protein
MPNLIEKLRSVIKYVKAGDALDRKDYDLARKHIDSAIELAGGGKVRSSLFEYFLRAAQIEEQFSTETTLERLMEAKRRIEVTSSLKSVDRDYLMSFCEIFEADIQGRNPPMPRLPKSEWHKVKAHFRRDYPLT